MRHVERVLEMDTTVVRLRAKRQLAAAALLADNAWHRSCHDLRLLDNVHDTIT